MTRCGALAPGIRIGADDEVGQPQLLANGVSIAEQRVDVGGHDVFQIPQPVDVDVQDGDVGLKPRRDLGRVLADDSTPQNHDVSRWYARYSAEQNPAAFLRSFEKLRPLLNAHAAGNFAHRRQTRQVPFRTTQRFVRQGSDACLQQRPRERLAGGKVQIGKEDLPFAAAAATPRFEAP